ncbi:MAG: hypothetical protein Kow0069_07500 [Promethearchaeota archaeon]
MRVGILFSEEDDASKTIRSAACDLLGVEPPAAGPGAPVLVKRARTPSGREVLLGTTASSLLEPGPVDEAFEADFLFFASRHRSESGQPALLVHAPGNWENAEYGGQPREVARTSGVLLARAFRALASAKETRALPHSVSLEVTHHGPTGLATPCAFVELGSRPADWTDRRAAAAVAEALVEAADHAAAWEVKKGRGGKWVPLGDARVGLGFGGTHYAPQFSKVVAETSFFTAHLVPKYHVRALTAELLEDAVENVAEEVSFFVLDWKGLNAADKNHLLPLLERFPGVEVLRARQVLKVR